jgi:hypothetical protein
MFTYKNTCIRRPMQHLGTKNGLTNLYTTTKRYTSCTTHGASIAPPLSPPSSGGGPPPPASGSDGPPPTGPSYPGGRRPLVIAETTVAHHTRDRHGGGTPTHCSRKLSSWMHDHMPSGTSCKTISRRWRISSKSTPATVGGACDGPAPGSSNRHLLAALSGSAGHPATSSHDVSLPVAVSSAPDEPTLSTTLPHAREVTHLHKQTIDSISIYIINIWMDISKNTKTYIFASSINIPR